jgi:hypothetical protein
MERNLKEETPPSYRGTAGAKYQRAKLNEEGTNLARCSCTGKIQTMIPGNPKNHQSTRVMKKKTKTNQ